MFGKMAEILRIMKISTHNLVLAAIYSFWAPIPFFLELNQKFLMTQIYAIFQYWAKNGRFSNFRLDTKIGISTLKTIYICWYQVLSAISHNSQNFNHFPKKGQKRLIFFELSKMDTKIGIGTRETVHAS